MSDGIRYIAQMFEGEDFVAEVFADTEEEAMREIMGYADMSAVGLTITLSKIVSVKVIQI